MKRITGYTKCPICEGEGQHTTKASDFERERIRAKKEELENLLNAIGRPGIAPGKGLPPKEYQECTKCKGEQVLPLWEYDD